MTEILYLLVGLMAGGIGGFTILDARRRNAMRKLRRRETAVEHRQDAIDSERRQLDAQLKRIQEFANAVKARQKVLEDYTKQLKQAQAEFQSRRVSYDELVTENNILKRDLRNLEIRQRKLHLDVEAQRREHEVSSTRAIELGTRFLNDNVKWIIRSVSANNYAACKQRLEKAIAWCREIGLAVSEEEQSRLIAELKAEFEKEVRAALEREEQSRMKARIREEQLREKEIERELKQLEREREAIQKALERALAEAKDEHSAEVERLKARLAEAEEKSQRTISQAQLTKSGHVYVISNVGSFGDGVFKIGMTRRLYPDERIKELGDASVPFPFDVHMMISSNDAPALETALHRQLHKLRINKVNPRKEFFRVDFDSIRQIVEQHHGVVEYTADAEALEYRQSLEISDEDEEYIEHVYEDAEDDRGGTVDDA
ncbi:MAG: GIY-YIG nuclease family protein [Phycisphaerae bacterium]|nr:GIY-YIG nuclease family protein [Phycisphaerae bacterium]